MKPAPDAAAAHALPAAFRERLAHELPEDAARVIAGLAPAERFGARLNPLIASPASSLEQLSRRYGGDIGVLEGIEHGLWMTQSVRAQMADEPLVRSGALYLQNPSSLLAALALAPSAGDEVLDLAAAPGGKTLHIAALLAGTGRLAAVESVKPRFHRLRANLQLGGADAVHLYLADGRQVGRKTPNRFDRVLLDAPCSSEARFDRSDPRSYAHWSTHKVASCARKQRGLLASAFAALKPGGRLVYCTCAFAFDENEGVVGWLLARVGTAARLLPYAPMGSCTSRPGLASALAPQLERSRRILPDGLFGGFYLAVLEKTALTTI